MIKIREWKSLKAVPSLQFGGGLRLVAHLVPYRGSMKCIHSIIPLYPSSYKPPNFSPTAPQLEVKRIIWKGLKA